MDVRRIVETLTVVTAALVVLGTLWQSINMDVMVSTLIEGLRTTVAQLSQIECG